MGCRIPPPSNLNDLIRRYEAGETASQIADELGVRVYRVTGWFRQAGVNLRSTSDRIRAVWVHRKRGSDGLPDRVICRLYAAGVSGKVLANAYEVPRSAVNAVLRRNGITIRNRSEGMLARWAFGNESASDLLGAAWAASTGHPISPDHAAHRALGKSRSNAHVGRYETELAQALNARGVSVTQQFPVGPYNIDIALDVSRVAVEVYTSGLPRAKPGRRSVLQRFQYLLNDGWTVLHVQAIGSFNCDRLTEYIVALAEAIRRNEPRWRGYGMVRGNGEPVASHGSQFDQLPHIPRTHPADEPARD